MLWTEQTPQELLEDSRVVYNIGTHGPALDRAGCVLSALQDTGTGPQICKECCVQVAGCGLADCLCTVHLDSWALLEVTVTCCCARWCQTGQTQQACTETGSPILALGCLLDSARLLEPLA